MDVTTSSKGLDRSVIVMGGYVEAPWTEAFVGVRVVYGMKRFPRPVYYLVPVWAFWLVFNRIDMDERKI